MQWKEWLRKAVQTAGLLFLAAVVVAKAQTFGGAGAAFTPFILQATSSGGSIPYHYIVSASANQDSTCVKTSAGQVYGWALTDNTSTPYYVKFYDQATLPTSSNTPVKTVGIPGNPAVAGNNKDAVMGVQFSAGICFRVTTGMPDNDTGAATAATATIEIDDYK